MPIRTIQLVYDTTSAIANGACNFQIPLQGVYDVKLRSVDVASNLALQMVVRSPQLRTSYTCSSTNGTDGQQTTLAIPPLSNNFILFHNTGTTMVPNPILFPRVFLQNTIQMSIVNMADNSPIVAGQLFVFTLEISETDGIIDTASRF